MEPKGTWRKPTWWMVSQPKGTRIPPHPILRAPFPVTCAPSVPSGIKESVCWGPPPAASPLKSCEYHALCSRFQELLLLPGEFPAPQNLPHSLAQCRALPRCLETSWKKDVWLRRRVGATAPSTTHSPTDDYFMPPPKRSLCYCESCRKLRGDEAHRRRGEPPREYALPFGWCRFNLRYGWDRVICVSLTVLQKGGSQEGAWKKLQNFYLGDDLGEPVTFVLSAHLG